LIVNKENCVKIKIQWQTKAHHRANFPNNNFVFHLLGLLPNNFECGKNDNGRTGEFITGSPNDQGKYYQWYCKIIYFIEITRINHSC
jgi:hypothetical protein